MMQKLEGIRTRLKAAWAALRGGASNVVPMADITDDLEAMARLSALVSATAEQQTIAALAGDETMVSAVPSRNEVI